MPLYLTVTLATALGSSQGGFKAYPISLLFRSVRLILSHQYLLSSSFLFSLSHPSLLPLLCSLSPLLPLLLAFPCPVPTPHPCSFFFPAIPVPGPFAYSLPEC